MQVVGLLTVLFRAIRPRRIGIPVDDRSQATPSGDGDSVRPAHCYSGCGVLFWSSLVVSLSLGFVTAYPVNPWLVRRGVKSGMQNSAALEPLL